MFMITANIPNNYFTVNEMIYNNKWQFLDYLGKLLDNAYEMKSDSSTDQVPKSITNLYERPGNPENFKKHYTK